MSKKVANLVATTLGVGYFPLAPGTFAAAASVIVWCILCFNIQHPYFWQLILVPVFIYVGVICSEKILLENEKDPSHVVIDEFAGQWISLLFISPSYISVLIGFVLFRVFDIAKPFGIRRMEKLNKGWGIMMDDVLAGVYSNLVLHFILFFHLW